MDVNTIKDLTPSVISNLSNQDILNLVVSGKIMQPKILTIPLDTALVDFDYPIAGNFLYITDTSDYSVRVDIRFNTIITDKWTFEKSYGVRFPFQRFWITSTAQAGAWVKVLVGTFYKDLFEVLDNRSAQAQASLLTDIKTNTTGLPSLVRSLSGDTGTQVNKNNTITTATTQIVHTVTAGKTLYLNSACLCLKSGGSTVPIIDLFVRDAGDSERYKLIQHEVAGGSSPSIIPRHFPTPVKIPANYDVCIRQSTAEKLYGQINGWEE